MSLKIGEGKVVKGGYFEIQNEGTVWVAGSNSRETKPFSINTLRKEPQKYTSRNKRRIVESLFLLWTE